MPAKLINNDIEATKIEFRVAFSSFTIELIPYVSEKMKTNGQINRLNT